LAFLQTLANPMTSFHEQPETAKAEAVKAEMPVRARALFRFPLDRLKRCQLADRPDVI
jgi:hypothetical protein